MTSSNVSNIGSGSSHMITLPVDLLVRFTVALSESDGDLVHATNGVYTLNREVAGQIASTMGVSVGAINWGSPYTSQNDAIYAALQSWFPTYIRTGAAA